MSLQLDRLARALAVRRLPRRYRLSSDGGQALVEYTLILALIAIAAIAALTELGNGIVNTLGEVTTAL
jgi:Flp pilus assembly pilin Flp